MWGGVCGGSYQVVESRTCSERFLKMNLISNSYPVLDQTLRLEAWKQAAAVDQ